ncbi:hypothetical protein DFH09DRAFT_1276731 [Mycena vulgaris]|nr:hypothetical protein DFH09DRAFT_1276731 [Mycena vulgaris]
MSRTSVFKQIAPWARTGAANARSYTWVSPGEGKDWPVAVEGGSGKGGNLEKERNSGRTFPISPGYPMVITVACYDHPVSPATPGIAQLRELYLAHHAQGRRGPSGYEGKHVRVSNVAIVSLIWELSYDDVDHRPSCCLLSSVENSKQLPLLQSLESNRANGLVKTVNDMKTSKPSQILRPTRVGGGILYCFGASGLHARRCRPRQLHPQARK